MKVHVARKACCTKVQLGKVTDTVRWKTAVAAYAVAPARQDNMLRHDDMLRLQARAPRQDAAAGAAPRRKRR